ncbi:MAG: Spy/CpxP family protein refolding chaperone [Sedimenticola sp.]|nr:Spy/CpxP family protein refolding chaperone [Sedimenticola sp.]MCW8921139.1 Spy/CpxP family protein refolding chaperone [Sedimenticola sp.]MCW8946482.1 Spy/CpxP family protein refolding chaperone [Sedimenticola sp.]MCW8974727.1 Spy/CpxP family protein refolding chaperone [Sedimenticola sp.]MDF1528849.1 Spy/CpxP family protein refolding chaperone [Sedimenticola sp.]
MKRSSKIIIAAVAVIGISTAVAANGRFDRCGYGQGQMSMQGGGYSEQWRHGSGRGMHGDPSARMEQGLDMMKYKLRITEAQEPAWQAFEQVLKSKAEKRMESRKKGGAGSQMSVSERVEKMRGRAGQMTEMADAIEQLYSQLTPEQQKLADEMRPMRGMSRMR